MYQQKGGFLTSFFYVKISQIFNIFFNMNKTNVDDMLLEMITPKVKEIEEKFSSGEGLTQDDINTLLLKSQYNHINHLDAKLDETVASVRELESKFVLLEEKVEHSIQKALNKNMVLLFFMMGVFLTLSKVIDKFL
jgi:uncharacterized coiled-coil DUF342 family protein